MGNLNLNAKVAVHVPRDAFGAVIAHRVIAAIRRTGSTVTPFTDSGQVMHHADKQMVVVWHDEYSGPGLFRAGVHKGGRPMLWLDRGLIDHEGTVQAGFDGVNAESEWLRDVRMSKNVLNAQSFDFDFVRPAVFILQPDTEVGIRRYSPWFESSELAMARLAAMSPSRIIAIAPPNMDCELADRVVDLSPALQWGSFRHLRDLVHDATWVATVSSRYAACALEAGKPLITMGHSAMSVVGVSVTVNDDDDRTRNIFSMLSGGRFEASKKVIADWVTRAAEQCVPVDQIGSFVVDRLASLMGPAIAA